MKKRGRSLAMLHGQLKTMKKATWTWPESVDALYTKLMYNSSVFACVFVCVGKPMFLHIGELVDGVDMRAEVGLLSRNIVIRGQMEASCYGSESCKFFSFDTFGGHLKVRHSYTTLRMLSAQARMLDMFGGKKKNSALQFREWGPVKMAAKVRR